MLSKKYYLVFIILATFVFQIYSVQAQTDAAVQKTQEPTPQATTITAPPPPPPPPPKPKGTPLPITNMSMDGNFDVTLRQAKVQDGILTTVLLYKNTTNARVKMGFPIADVYYVDNQAKKKYLVLQDENKKWLGAPICKDQLSDPNACFRGGVEVPMQGKQVVWFKFPAPTSDIINLVIPSAIPFENVAVTR